MRLYFWIFLFLLGKWPVSWADVMKGTEYVQEKASKYAQISLQGQGTLYLSFRDLGSFIQTSVSKAIDYGCGAGRSTRYLKSLEIPQVDGFDISEEMVQQAKEFDPAGFYEVIASGKVPTEDSMYDLALMSFVTVALESKEDLLGIFQELYRVLKPGGQVLSLTLSEAFWNPERKWLTYKQDYPENYAPVSGQKSRLTITSVDLELTDTFWAEKEIIDLAKKAGLSFVKIHGPLGKEEDGISWFDEYMYAPYTIFVFEKR